jgi:hypothetical protein
MSSRKKLRPSFDVPAEVESGGDSGWVYRSAKPAAEPPETRLANEPAPVIAFALAAMSQAMTFGIMVAMIPFAITLRTLRSLREN